MPSRLASTSGVNLSMSWLTTACLPRMRAPVLGAQAVVRLGVVQLRVLFQVGDGLGKYAFGDQYGGFH
jgi:hypothetical protein